MKVLSDNGLRPLTYQEALVHLTQNPELKEQLKEKSFYLASNDEFRGRFRADDQYNIDDNGTLIRGRGSPENTVYVYRGNGPLLFGVRSDFETRIHEKRFDIYADISPRTVA